MQQRTWNINPGRSWGPLELGESRDAVLALLSREQLEIDADDGATWYALAEIEAELFFTDDSQSHLWQIGCEGKSARIHGQPLVGQRLEEALLACRVQQFQDTLWTLHQEPEVYEPEAGEPPGAGSGDRPLDATAEALLGGGVLWIRSQGLGLSLCDGLVDEVYIRLPRHVPHRGYGPLTDAQLELAISDDLPRRLLGHFDRPRRKSWLWRLATAALVMALVWFGIDGFKYQQMWHNAPRAQGKVLAVEPAPDGRDVHLIEYQDSTGNTHHVRWTLADIYVPREVGETVEVPYLPHQPTVTMGPARINDAGFTRFMPSLIATLLVYLFVLVIDFRLQPRGS